jgi:hypothetical protein
LTGKIDPATEIEKCFDMTPKQRLIGFCICAAFGWIITFMSLSSYHKVSEGEATPVALSYSLGSLIEILAVMFLWGPKK